MPDAVSERYKEALRLGHVAVAKGRPREAVQHYEEAGRLAPDRPLPLVNMGSVYLQMRKPKEAIGAYDEALRRAPTDITAIRGKAQALEAEGDRKEASILVQRAGELEAREQANQQAAQARSSAAAGMERHFAVAVGARQAGDDTVAVQAFMAAALGYLEQGAHGAAFDAMMRALAVDPGALNVHLVMADVYLRRGWKELGVQRLLLIEHSLQLDADPGALRALAEVSGRHRGLDPRIDRLAATHA